MTESLIEIERPARAASAPWTCPFCPLLCDGFGVQVNVSGLTLTGSDCPRARAALATFGPAASTARPRVNGVPCALDAAIEAAAQALAASRQPLFGGLGTEVSGARALYRLACDTGAICDAAQGQALTEGLRALQDRGGFTTTLAEVRTRADLLVCVGEVPTARYPEFFNRCGMAATDPRVVVLAPEDGAGGAPGGDLFDTLARLAALLSGAPLPSAAPAVSVALAELAQRLQAARYAVIVYEPGLLPAHAALIIETIHRLVGTLNLSTRAAALALGGGEGASTVNQVFTWLGGLPLRSRAGPAGLEHEPVCFDAQRLLSDGAVDCLLWVSSFSALPLPSAAAKIPRIVLGHPDLATSCGDAIFIPVATPGIGVPGHLFRTDGSVLMPLRPVRAETLPTVAAVVGRLTQAVRGLRRKVSA